LRAAQEKYGDNLVVLLVDEQETVEEVKAFAERYNLKSVFVMDDRGTVAQLYRMFSTPTTYFISPNGVIQSIWSGVFDMSWVDENMQAAGF